jgi:hypothetical protein
VAKTAAEQQWRSVGHFSFFEMDVWFTQSPLPLFHEAAVPLLFGSHQDNPNSANIGTYHSAATATTTTFWGTMLEYMHAHPATFDQQLVNSCLHYLGNGCEITDPLYGVKGKRCIPVPILMCKSPVWRTGEHAEAEAAINEAPMCCPLPREFNREGFLDYHLLDANAIASFDAPLIVPGVTIAGHTLTGKPLTSSTAKKTIAKELQLWLGVDGYYNSRYTVRPLPPPFPPSLSLSLTHTHTLSL